MHSTMETVSLKYPFRDQKSTGNLDLRSEYSFSVLFLLLSSVYPISSASLVSGRFSGDPHSASEITNS